MYNVSVQSNGGGGGSNISPEGMSWPRELESSAWWRGWRRWWSGWLLLRHTSMVHWFRTTNRMNNNLNCLNCCLGPFLLLVPYTPLPFTVCRHLPLHSKGSRLVSLYLAGDSGGLEKSGRPGPLGHDGGGRQTDGHFASRVKSRVEIVRVVIDVLPHLRVESLSNWRPQIISTFHLESLSYSHSKYADTNEDEESGS